MVNPADILTVARLLAAVPGEAFARKAVSAAYYAAFAHAEALGRVGAGSQQHRRVARYLRRTHPAAAESLQSLRGLRIEADYLLQQDFEHNPLEACELAATILAVS